MNLLLNKNNNAGFTLVEGLVYIFMFVILSTGALTLLFSLSDLFVQYELKQDVLSSGTTAMERMLLEIRESDEVTLSGSIIASSTAGVLILENGTSTVRIEKNGNKLEIYKEGVFESVLHTSTVEVPELTFYHYVKDEVELVRIHIKLQSSSGSLTEELDITSGAVIRGSYAAN